MKLDKSHTGKVVKVEGTQVVEVPDGVFSTGDVVVLFNNTDSFICIDSKVKKSWLSARTSKRSKIEFPPRALGNLLFIEDDAVVFSGDLR